MKFTNIMVLTLVSLYCQVTPPTPTALLSIQPLNCPKEQGEGRYESTYLLAFVQGTALSVRVLELLTSSPAYSLLLAPVS